MPDEQYVSDRDRPCVVRHVKLPRGKEFTLRFEYASPGDPGYMSLDEAQDVFADIVGRSIVKRAKEILAERVKEKLAAMPEAEVNQ